MIELMRQLKVEASFPRCVASYPGSIEKARERPPLVRLLKALPRLGDNARLPGERVQPPRPVNTEAAPLREAESLEAAIARWESEGGARCPERQP